VSNVPYDMTVTVVENAPVPVNDDDFVQVGRDDLDAILDYATHTAMFKAGGAEFMSTIPLFQRFQKQAALYNRKLLEIAEYNSMLRWVSQMEKSQNPVEQPEGIEAT